MQKPALSKFLSAAIVMLSLSCVFLQNTVPPTGSTPGVTRQSAGDVSPVSNQTPSGDLEVVTDPRVDGTLALLSVQMDLQTVIPGEEANRVLISVDATGNVRIEMGLPVFENSMVTPESPDWNVFEIFIVDGKGYARSGKTGKAEADPVQDDALSELLYSPTGPGMWLILVPEENFTSVGNERKGGFDAVKYSVEGSLELGEVLGEFWVDEATGALVGANLSVAEKYFRPMDDSASGTATIAFSVEKADVQAITVP